MSETVEAARLRNIVERIEGLEAEKAEIAELIRKVYAEAKGDGYDTKALRALVALRKRNSDEVAEADAILAMYREALGV